MNKTELVKALAEKIGKSQKETKEVMEALQEVVFAEMAAEGEVKLFDGVTLSGKMKEAHDARSPLTGDTVHVEAKVMPKAKFGKAVKDFLNA